MEINEIRRQFPILGSKIGSRPLVYLDNTATSQTPASVVECITHLYEHTKANVHRGVHTLSQEATDLQEATRRRVRDYINAASEEEIVFTRGTTEAINLVAASYGGAFFHDGDEVVLTVVEHRANIVPWQLLQARHNIKLRVVDIDGSGKLDIEQYRSYFNERTVFASFCHVSNVLGDCQSGERDDGLRPRPRSACRHRRRTSIAASQDRHTGTLGADFYVFSSHKMYGPTGVGVLYGRKELLEKMPPYQGGGEMIKHVSFERTTFADLPFKFEAGTPDFIDIAAFTKALDFIESIGIENIHRHEEELLSYCTEEMMKIPGMRIFGTTAGKSAVISFLVNDIHPYDLGLLLDKMGIAVRTGHHCAQPLMERFGIPGTVRASFAVYNTREEVDTFIVALKKVVSMF